MKINILSPGRFHVCDLARELDKNGWDVKFYSFVPTNRTSKFGLPSKCNKSVIGFVFPFLVLTKIFPKINWIKKYHILFQDFITGIYMRKCDILIAMSGNYVYSLRKAKKQGSLVILERGSKHILEQKKILERIPSLIGTTPVPDMNVKRELEGYQMADYIAIASNHVKESFLLHHYPLEKLFVNPYGVDLSMFHPMPEVEKEFDVIMVGGWSYQKGCDLIIEAVRKLNIRFLHVGGIVDVEFPMERGFKHVDSVDQSLLVNYYNKAKVFILPSRQDGFGMVLCQATSCNIPIICSKDTGGPDMKKYFGNTKAISILEVQTVKTLMVHIQEMLKFVDAQSANTVYYDMKGKEQLTWEAYGKRYSKFLKQITEQ